MKIRLAAYPPGVHRISESLDPSSLDLDDVAFRSPIKAELLLDRHDPYLQFNFQLTAHAHLECDRCLAEYDFTIQVHAPMLYVLGNSVKPVDPDDPEISYIPATTTDLDIGTDLRDFIILALPEKRLCRDDCQGLCPQCGADLNHQPCDCSRR